MRRWWFVPLVVLALMLFLRARPAGYSTPSTTETASAVALITTAVVPSPTLVSVLPTPPDEPPAYSAPTPTMETSSIPAAPATVPPPTSTPEPPALAPDIAPPTAPPQPTAAADQLPVPTIDAALPLPARLRIPDLGLDLKPVAVGVDENRVPIVPKHDVGWFDASALPGRGSNVVFWGHVLRWRDSPTVPAPFARLHELPPGATIDITLGNGEQYRYRVTQQVQVRPEEVDYILPTTSERVTLVSCIGDNVILEGVLSKEFRLITIAEPF